VKDLFYGLIAEVSKAFRAIGSGVRQMWDNLGISMLLSAIWWGLAFSPMWLAFNIFNNITKYYVNEMPPTVVIFGLLIGYMIMVAVASLLAAPVTTAVYAISYSIYSERDASIKEFFKHFRRYYKVSFGFAFITMMVFGLLLLNAGYYLRGGTIYYMLGVVMAILAAFLAISLQYMFPVAVQQGVGVKRILKRSLLLSLDNMTVSLVLAVFGGILIYLSIRAALPMIILYMGIMSAVHNLALVELLKKYDGPPPGSN
jgi:uncharacterized membrane protein YesL